MAVVATVRLLDSLGIPSLLVSCPGTLTGRKPAEFRSVIASYWRVIQVLLRQSRCRETALLVSVRAGHGIGLDIGIVALARLWNVGLVLRYDAIGPLRRHSIPQRCLVRIAGRNARHISLCKRMGRMLEECGVQKERVYSIGNTALVRTYSEEAKGPEAVASEPSSPARTYGFIGTLSVEKGLSIAYDTIAEARVSSSGWERLRLAGRRPEEPRARRLLDAMIKEDWVDYVGEVEGEEKWRFFEGIDVLLLPSRYENEAAPLVVLEAASRGVPSIVSGIGCLPEMLGGAVTICPMDWTQSSSAESLSASKIGGQQLRARFDGAADSEEAQVRELFGTLFSEMAGRL